MTPEDMPVFSGRYDEAQASMTGKIGPKQKPVIHHRTITGIRELETMPKEIDARLIEPQIRIIFP